MLFGVALSERLVRGGLGNDVDPPTTLVELHAAIDQCPNRVITAQTDILAGVELRATLADDDVAGDDRLAAEFFDAEPLADAIAAVLDASLTFLMSHMSG